MFSRPHFGAVFAALMCVMVAGPHVNRAVGAVAFPSSPQIAQKPAAGPPSREAILSAARTIIGKARYASLITLDEQGQPQARIVDPFEPESNFAVWVGTNALTRKVAQIRANPRVTMIYFDPGTFGYVTLLGRARVVADPTEKATHWKDAWASLYKDKNHGDDYVLIRVEPSRLEVVSVALGIVNDPTTWRPVSIDMR